MENELKTSIFGEGKSSIFEDTVHLEHTTKGKRFANYIIDIISFYGFVVVFSIVGALISPDFLEWIDKLAQNNIADRLLTMVAIGVYIGVIEAVFKGRTLGKLITGTRAVDHEGNTITPAQGFLRGLSRAVPFEAFSALGNSPWHDKWTGTFVVDIKKSILPR